MSRAVLKFIIAFIASQASFASAVGAECAPQVVNDNVSLLQSTLSVNQRASQKAAEKADEKALGADQQKLENAIDIKIRAATESAAAPICVGCKEKNIGHCCCTAVGALGSGDSSRTWCTQENTYMIDQQEGGNYDFAPDYAQDRRAVFDTNAIGTEKYPVCCKWKENACKRFFQGRDARFIKEFSPATCSAEMWQQTQQPQEQPQPAGIAPVIAQDAEIPPLVRPYGRPAVAEQVSDDNPLAGSSSSADQGICSELAPQGDCTKITSPFVFPGAGGGVGECNRYYYWSNHKVFSRPRPCINKNARECEKPGMTTTTGGCPEGTGQH